MTRENQKDKELLSFAQLMMTSEDYAQRIQRLNGMRMGLTNKYKTMDDYQISRLTRVKRLDLWKQLIDAYK